MEEYEDYCYCPSCGSNVAVVENDIRYGEVGHCKYDCGYKWYMLIEPDPETFNQKHPYIENEILGHESKIVLFEEDLEEIYYEDKNRYNRILKYSDLNNTLIDRTLSFDKDVPNNLEKKRIKFFQNKALEEQHQEEDYYQDIIKKFLNEPNEYNFNNLLYVLITVIEMSKEDKNIIYDIYNKNHLNTLMAGMKEDDFTRMKELLSYKYNIQLKYQKEEEKKQNNDKKLINKKEEKREQDKKEEITSRFNDFYNKETTYGLNIKELLKEIKEYKPISSFMQTTPFIISLKEFYKNIKSNVSIPSLIDFDNKIVFMHISHKTLINFLNNLILNKYSKYILIEKPDKISYEEYKNLFKETTKEEWEKYYKNNKEILIKTFEEFYDKKEQDKKEYLKQLKKDFNLKENLTEKEFENWKQKEFNNINPISYHEYEELLKEKNKDEEMFFHKHTNTVQIFTSMINDEAPKILTYRIKNKEIKELEEKLKKENINFETNDSIKDKTFITLNGDGIIKGEIYFPKKDEENIEKGKILVIPTASEEYFIPAISQMNKAGCIITEKGSKTAHLVINSKEFNMNLILIENAMELFKEGEEITIDLKKEKII